MVLGFNTGAVTALGTGVVDTLIGTVGVDVIVGGQGGDTLIGGGGADVLRGGEGADVLDVADATFARVDGGSGADTLRLSGDALVLDFTVAGNQSVTGIEAVNLSGTGAGVIFDTLSVLALSDTTNTLTLTGDATTSLKLVDSRWVLDAGDATTNTLTNGLAIITIDEGVTVSAAFANAPATVDLAALDGADGFQIEGIGLNDDAGYSVSGIGDFNGDGFEDVIVGANGD